MSRDRFVTARSLFETFPELATKSTVAPTDDPPIAFLKNLSAVEKFDEAIAFCAHLLPRREAVWWACESVRRFLRETLSSEAKGLLAAEAWVGAPSEDNRLVALRIGTQSDTSDPLTWLAFSAGWAGGMLSTNPTMPVPVPAYMTARAGRIAILLAARHLASPDRKHRMRECIAAGARLAEPGQDVLQRLANPTANRRG
jgi:hypothetical protein